MATKRATRKAPVMPDDVKVRYEFTGILIGTAGAVMLAALTFGASGTATEAIQTALFTAFGLGAWVAPALLTVAGAFMCFALQPLRLSVKAPCAVGLFWVALAGIHCATPNGAELEPDALITHGGYAGAALTIVLRTLFGDLGTAIVLGGLAFACVAALVRRPISHMALDAYDRAGTAAVNVRGHFARIAEQRRRRRIAESGNPRSRARTHRTAGDPSSRRRARRLLREAGGDSVVESDHDEAGEPPARPPRRSRHVEPEAAVITPRPTVISAPGGSGTPPSGDESDATQLSLADGLGLGPRRAGAWAPPPPDLLDLPSPVDLRRQEQEAAENIAILEDTLDSFKIGARVVAIERGPAITRYEVEPDKGIRVSRIANLADDLARVLEAMDVRIEAPVPGKSVIGIEVPNRTRSLVTLRDVLESEEMRSNRSLLAFAIGKDIAGQVVVGDLRTMPHLLVAGATNSGKSVCLNALILSILYRASPDDVKFLMIDPKRVELSLFDEIPHLIAPVVHDAREAAGLLRHAIVEMEERYRSLASHGVRNITEYHELREIEPDLPRMPYIVIVVDELADLMMQAAAEFEHSICRIAQLARAVGIHLVVATQRPSVNVVTGTIKANIPSRIAFAVSSQTDSRVILDTIGADRLIGQGDMLFSPIDASKPRRVQGAYVSGKEINRVVGYLKAWGEPEYSMEPMPVETMKAPVDLPTGVDDEGVDDDLFSEIVQFVMRQRRVSTSMLQRKFRIGYNRAARLIEILEEKGVVGPADGSRPRRVLSAFGGELDYSEDEDDGSTDG